MTSTIPIAAADIILPSLMIEPEHRKTPETSRTYKTLVIPDIHDQIETAQSIVDREIFDQVVFLGDFFDGHSTGVKEARESAAFLRSLLSERKAHILIGNHDIHYFWNTGWHSSGYSLEKQDAILMEMGPDHYRHKAKLYLWVEGWLLTHAGLSAYLAPATNLKGWLEGQSRQAFHDLGVGDHHFLLEAGRARGGIEKCGGIIWCDWREFIPICNVDQLFGHTRANCVRETFANESHSVCLDTGLKHYAILQNGQIEIKKV
jgi:Calcineurin-like phosphoesterase